MRPTVRIVRRWRGKRMVFRKPIPLKPIKINRTEPAVVMTQQQRSELLRSGWRDTSHHGADALLYGLQSGHLRSRAERAGRILAAHRFAEPVLLGADFASGPDSTVMWSVGVDGTVKIIDPKDWKAE
jgi:hypothetical protein